MVLTRRRSRPRYVLLLLVLAAVTIITLAYRGSANGVINSAKNGARDLLRPVESAVTSALRPVGNFFEGAVHYGALQQQNAKLIQEVDRLRAQGVAAGNALRQAQALQRLDHLPFLGGISTVQATVIAGPVSNFMDTIELDRGRNSGVTSGMPVVSGSGLIGRVTSASRSTSTVLLVTDPTSVVGVRWGSSQPTTAVGQGPERPLSVQYVTSKIAPGTPMVTSGLQGEIYPGGLPVGRVSSSVLRPSAQTWSVALQPVADLASLQYVSVLLWTPPA